MIIMLSTATKPMILHRAKTLSDYKLRGIDGNIGTIKEFYFDDHNWTVRYIVANTGNWLTGRQVLISLYSLGAVNNEEQFIAVNLTQKQIEDIPTFEIGQTISPQFEDAHNTYYGNGPNISEADPNIARDPNMRLESVPSERMGERRLHNTSNVNGYEIEASDGEIGDVKDFIIEDQTWAIRYLIVDTGSWLPGKKVLIAPQWIDRLSLEESKVFVNLSRDAIEQSPEFTEESLLSRDYEEGLYKHYNRQGYWIE
jgi:hypothetical protein